MIFGSPEGSKSIKDPSEGARIERVWEQEIIDVVESDFMELGKIVDLTGNREMESREPVEVPPISVSREMESREPVEVPPISVSHPIEIEIEKSTEIQIRIQIDSEIPVDIQTSEVPI